MIEEKKRKNSRIHEDARRRREEKEERADDEKERDSCMGGSMMKNCSLKLALRTSIEGKRKKSRDKEKRKKIMELLREVLWRKERGGTKMKGEPSRKRKRKEKAKKGGSLSYKRGTNYKTEKANTGEIPGRK